MKKLAPIVVIGGGHAGVEAAHAAARMGADVVLLTLKKEALVRLSCNPAIGGIGKGHLVREIDALGGVMGFAADLAGIHFRVLNRSRGPAVQGPRVQQDHDAYPEVVRKIVAGNPRITVEEGEAADFLVRDGNLTAVSTADGRIFPAAAAVLTTGTFLCGKLFCGEEIIPGGRRGEPPSETLHPTLVRLGLRLGRFKTGTPPRLDRDSLDYSAFEPQPGDRDPVPFSFQHWGDGRFVPPLPQLTTHLAFTNPAVHGIVEANLHLSPLFAGKIKAKGPRYCPSFEDKVVKFGDRDRHLLHLEPMGLGHPWVYINGFSTSLPPEVQAEMVASISGLEKARISRYGYAVEYDFVPPDQLLQTLAVRTLPGLFLAGQICGTTGYEEAAALGLVAGTNAVLHALARDPWVPDRLTSYIGVMVDDLTTAGVLEPYRMFTSRAEMRLSLAADNADRRLTSMGESLGLVQSSRAARARARWDRLESALQELERDGDLRASRPATPADSIRRGEDASQVIDSKLWESLGESDRETLVSLIRYRGFLEREQREAGRLKEMEAVRIPENFGFEDIPGLSNEIRERLAVVKPSSLGQASRIPGMTPAALGLLAAAISLRRRAS